VKGTALIAGTKSANETGATETITASALGSGTLVWTAGALSNTTGTATLTPGADTASATTATFTFSATTPSVCTLGSVAGHGAGATEFTLTTQSTTSVVLTPNGTGSKVNGLTVTANVIAAGTCTVTIARATDAAFTATYNITTGYTAGVANVASASTSTFAVVAQSNTNTGDIFQYTSGKKTFLAAGTDAVTTPAGTSGSRFLGYNGVLKDALGNTVNGSLASSSEQVMCSVDRGYVDFLNAAPTLTNLSYTDTTIQALAQTVEIGAASAAGVFWCAVSGVDTDFRGDIVLTVKTVGGTLLYSETVHALGKVASVTVTSPANLIAGSAATSNSATSNADDAVAVALKDASGTAYTATYANTGTAAENNRGGGKVATAASILVTYTDTNGTASASTNLTQHANNGAESFDIPANTCGSADAGRSLKFSYTYTSGGINITGTDTTQCVAPYVSLGAATAKVDGGVSYGNASSTTACAPGETIVIEIAATDGAGRTAGLQSTITVDVTKSDATATTSALSFDGDGLATYTWTCGTTSGQQYVILSTADGNTSDYVSTAWSKKFTATVTNGTDALTAKSLSVGPKGRLVTASGFAPKSVVKFEVEIASTGVVRTYSRLANASGVATWRNPSATLKYVTAYPASSTTSITETVEAKWK
jgi:hypothetical protein